LSPFKNHRKSDPIAIQGPISQALAGICFFEPPKNPMTHRIYLFSQNISFTRSQSGDSAH
jgi:hypothetical protein